MRYSAPGRDEPFPQILYPDPTGEGAGEFHWLAEMFTEVPCLRTQWKGTLESSRLALQGEVLDHVTYREIIL